MQYVNYDENGNITAQFACKQYDGQISTELGISEVGKFKVVDGVVTDISDTDDYKAKVLAEKNTIRKSELQAQIAELDLKRIRAIVEGGNYSDTQTWLEYYTEQIIELRAEIAAL